MKHLFLLITAFMVFSSSAHAILEFRASYTSMDGEFDIGGGDAGLNGLGVDAIVSLPLFPIAGGIRHEILEDSGADLEVTRTSLLASWRIIDTGILIGGVLTYGIAHSAERNNIELNIDESYTAGVEGGIKFIGDYVFAGEMGYAYYDLANSDKITGPYIKAHIGYTF